MESEHDNDYEHDDDPWLKDALHQILEVQRGRWQARVGRMLRWWRLLWVHPHANKDHES